MKSTIQYATSKKRIYPVHVLKAIMDSGIQNYSHDNEYYMLKQNGKWKNYEQVSRECPWLKLPILDLDALEVAN